jgi:hypothetical protein
MNKIFSGIVVEHVLLKIWLETSLKYNIPESVVELHFTDASRLAMMSVSSHFSYSFSPSSTAFFCYNNETILTLQTQDFENSKYVSCTN